MPSVYGGARFTDEDCSMEESGASNPPLSLPGPFAFTHADGSQMPVGSMDVVLQNILNEIKLLATKTDLQAEMSALHSGMEALRSAYTDKANGKTSHSSSWDQGYVARSSIISKKASVDSSWGTSVALGTFSFGGGKEPKNDFNSQDLPETGALFRQSTPEAAVAVSAPSSPIQSRQPTPTIPSRGPDPEGEIVMPVTLAGDEEKDVQCPTVSSRFGLWGFGQTNRLNFSGVGSMMPNDGDATAKSLSELQLPNSTPAPMSRGIFGPGEQVDLQYTQSRTLRPPKNDTFRQPSNSNPDLGAPHQSNKVCSPDSSFRTAWEMGSALVLLYDSIIIPYIMAWSMTPSGVILWANTSTIVFWSLDVLFTLNTGYYINGYVERRRSAIFRRYLKRTLSLDVTICVVDWTTLIIEYLYVSSDKRTNNDADAVSLLRIVKINRIFRIISVLRLSSIWARLEKIHHMFLSDTWMMVSQVGAIFFGILWVIHLLSCCWIMIATQLPSDTGVTWLDVTDVQTAQPYKDTTRMYQYLTAYHWAISQLTPGSMQVNARSSPERLFNIFSLLVGLLFCSALISQLSALMVQLSLSTQAQNKSIKQLRRYLRYNLASPSLATRVEKEIQLRMKLRASRAPSEADCTALSLLSRSLKGELMKDMYSPHVLKLPLFAILDKLQEPGEDAFLIRDVCSTTTCIQLHNGDELFCTGTTMEMSYVLIRGEMEYLQEANSTEVSIGTWIAWVAFWTNWQSKGTLEAKAQSDLLVIDKTKVQTALLRYREPLRVVRDYHKVFCQVYHAMPSSALNDITESVDAAVVVMGMTSDMRSAISEPALQMLRAQFYFWRRAKDSDIDNLYKEIQLGKSILLFNEFGNPFRVVFVVALRILQAAGGLLVEVAQVKNGQITPQCRLPGTKLREGETTYLAAQRVLAQLAEELPSIISTDTFVGEHGDISVEEKTSQTYALTTQYRRAVYPVILDASDIGTAPPGITWPITGSIDGSRLARFSSAERHAASGAVVAQRIKRLSFNSLPSDAGEQGVAVTSQGSLRSTMGHASSLFTSKPRSTVVRNSMSSNQSEARAVELLTNLPWLSSHYPHHISVCESLTGNFAVYAWLTERDFDLLGKEDMTKLAALAQPFRQTS